MLKVLFFARIREQLGRASLDVEWRQQVSDLDALQQQLCLENGALWREVLGQDNIICAINQTVVDGDAILQDGDEIAFFPPVTGG